MRHRVGHRKLQRTSSHRTALFRNMAAALIKHEQITTTTAKAKELRPYVEKLVTLAKKGGLSNRRLAQARLMDETPAGQIVRRDRRRAMPARDGGYTRIIKAGIRASDAAPIAIIEFVDRDVAAKGQDSGPGDERRGVRGSLTAGAGEGQLGVRGFVQIGDVDRHGLGQQHISSGCCRNRLGRGRAASGRAAAHPPVARSRG